MEEGERESGMGEEWRMEEREETEEGKRKGWIGREGWRKGRGREEWRKGRGERVRHCLVSGHLGGQDAICEGVKMLFVDVMMLIKGVTKLFVGAVMLFICHDAVSVR